MARQFPSLADPLGETRGHLPGLSAPRMYNDHPEVFLKWLLAQSDEDRNKEEESLDGGLFIGDEIVPTVALCC